jgi:pyruvate dehydrogenase E2 component (dihydrolipoamide acetyltransferase)
VAQYQFRLPELGEGMHEGEIVKWHIKPGDVVEEDQVIMDVQNDKAVVEVPSPVNGKVVELNVKEGTVCVVGDPLVTFEVEGELPADAGHGGQAAPAASSAAPASAAATAGSAGSAAAAPSPAAAPAPAAAPSAAATPAAVPALDRAVLATPSVRKLAREKGVALAQVPGTGRHGQVTRDDVLTFVQGGGAAAAAPTAPAAAASAATPAQPAAATPARAAVSGQEERVPLKGIRKVIAQAMVKSVYTAPHVTLMDEVEVSALMDFRNQMKPLAEKKGVKVTYLPFIVKALVGAAREFPVLNASIDDERNEIVYKKHYDIGIATDTDNGLIVPVVAEADRKNIWTIASDIKDLATRAREGKLAPHEMKGSTITITNIGSAGGMFFTPVINWPEVAILGTGRISQKPVVKNGEVVVGNVMALSLSFDHRIIDGATAQYALNYIKQLLEDPRLMIMEV